MGHYCEDCGKDIARCECPPTPWENDTLTTHDHNGLAKAFNDMQAKMRVTAAKGRSGWHDPAQCPADRLRAMLQEAVYKGDAVDVLNFAMMLNARGEPTNIPTDDGAIPAPMVGTVWRHTSNRLYMVYAISNDGSTDYARYPIMVQYIGEDGKCWSRPLRDWDRSMTYAPFSDWNFDKAWSSLNPWYKAATEMCDTAHIGWHRDNPRRTINELIDWHVQVALDPAVSSDAAALVGEGKKAGRAAIDEWEKLKDPVVLHINLLRGFPACLTTEQLVHIAGDEVQKAVKKAALAGRLHGKLESIDTPEFRRLYLAWREAVEGTQSPAPRERQEWIAYIDDHTAAAVAKARQEGWLAGGQHQHEVEKAAAQPQPVAEQADVKKHAFDFYEAHKHDFMAKSDYEIVQACFAHFAATATLPPLKERLHGNLEIGRDPQYEPWSSFSPKQWTRVAVPGGWIVQSGVSMTFVPDPNHEWT